MTYTIETKPILAALNGMADCKILYYENAFGDEYILNKSENATHNILASLFHLHAFTV